MTGITNIILTDSGDAYSSTPTVTIDLPTAPIAPAEITLFASSNRVASISIDSGGYYYDSVPTITIDLPTAPVAPAQLTAVMSGDRLNRIDIDSSGYYYTSPPTITIDPPPPISDNVTTEQAKFGSRSYKFRESTLTNENFSLDTTYYNNGTSTYISFFVYSDDNWASNTTDWGVVYGPQNTLIYNIGDDLVTRTAVFPEFPNITVSTFSNALISGWNYIVIRRYYYANSPTTFGSVTQLFRNGSFLGDPGSGGNMGSNSIPLINNNVTLVNDQIPGTGTSISTNEAYIDDIAYVLNQTNRTSAISSALDFEIDTATAVASIGYFGGVVNDTITNVGSGYTSTPAVTVSAPTGTPEDFRATASVLNLVNGRVNSVSLTDSGGGYISTPDATIDAPTGTPVDFRATAAAVLDNDTRKISAVNITDSGGGYITAPNITIADPVAVNFIVGENVTQTLPSGVVMSGEVAKFSDSDYKVHLIHVGADDGNYHTFVTGSLVIGVTSGASGTVTAVTEENQISNNEQNDDFSTLTVDFLDFTEDNPFGDPENN